MVHFPESSTSRGVEKHPGEPALALRTQPMATTLECVETREVVRCDFCSLVQYRTINSLCRKCRRPLDIEEREIRKARHLSQRQLAGRMQVPRTYISKIENGKAIPTLGSLERLAAALQVDVCQLVRDSRSRRDDEVTAILADPFVAEIAALLPRLDSLHRTLFYGAVRDAAMGRRRTA